MINRILLSTLGAAFIAVPASADVTSVQAGSQTAWQVTCNTNPDTGTTHRFYVSGDKTKSQAEAEGRKYCKSGFTSIAFIKLKGLNRREARKMNRAMTALRAQ